MSTMKKTAPRTTGVASKEVRSFPPAAFDYHDDVTKEAVDKVRAKAADRLKKADLELVDGLGQYAI
jgi:hypothetical protein